jgi:hypothetical protein
VDYQFSLRAKVISRLGFELIRIWNADKDVFSFQRLIEKSYGPYGGDRYFCCTTHENGKIVWFETHEYYKDSDTVDLSFADVFEVLSDEEKNLAILHFDLLVGGSSD